MSKRLLFSAIMATIMMSAAAVYSGSQSNDSQTATAYEAANG